MKSLSLSIANYFKKELKFSPDNVEIVAYGLEVIFSNFLSLFIALALGIVWGIWAEVLVVAFVWLLIRSFAGGAHCNTIWRCAFTSSFILVFCSGASLKLSHILDYNAVFPIIISGGIFVVVVTSTWAPGDNEKKRISSELRRKSFKGKAIIAEISLVILLLSIALFKAHAYSSLLLAAAIAMGAEGLILTPLGYRVMAIIDRFLDFLSKIITLKGG